MAFPKKLSAYMAFSNANRDRVKARLIAEGHEKPSIADIARAISVEWNAKSDDEKAVRDATIDLRDSFGRARTFVRSFASRRGDWMMIRALADFENFTTDERIDDRRR